MGKPTINQHLKNMSIMLPLLWYCIKCQGLMYKKYDIKMYN